MGFLIEFYSFNCFRNQSSEVDPPPEAESSLELLVFLVTLVQKCDRGLKTPIFLIKNIGSFGVFHTFEGFQ